MEDKLTNGKVFFSIKTCSNMITPETRINELIVLESDYLKDNKYQTPYFVIIRRPLLNLTEEENYSIDKLLNIFNSNLESEDFIKNLSIDEFNNVLEIIKRNHQLQYVDKYIQTFVCDGVHEEIYFECDTFKMSTEGDCIIDSNYFDSIDLLQIIKKASCLNIIKNLYEKSIVSNAVNDVLKYLRSLNVYFYEEDVEYTLQERKHELEEYILKGCESSSMYYSLEVENKYYPTIKLYSKSGKLIFTSKDRKFNTIILRIYDWDMERDLPIIEEICKSNKYIWCESDKEDDQYCYTIMMKK